MFRITPDRSSLSRRIRAASWAGAACLAVAAAAQADMVLNEVLYDPLGADGGREFVELYNPGPEAIALDGLRLEFANGAVGDVWELRWAGGPEVVEPGRRFLIADRGWDGESVPDAVVSLGLQNGPDAVRISREAGPVDRVGYGALEDPALFEGWPHPGATGGRSLARRPDGHDTDHNDIDWFVADEPTPGTPNVERWSLTQTSVELSPPCWAGTGGLFELRLGWLNDGLESYPPVVGLLSGGDGEVLGGFELPGSAPGDVLTTTVAWVPFREGVAELEVTVPRPLEGDTLRFDAGTAWAGPPPLRFSEVMPAPASGRPEWLELQARREDGDVDLAGWSFADEGGERRGLPPRLLARGDRLVLTADEEAFAHWVLEHQLAGAPWPCDVSDLGWTVAEPVDGWPVLNNTASGDRPWADRLMLRDPSGTVVDWVAWGGEHRPAVVGRSLERLPGAGGGWAPSTSAVGATPGCVNSVAAVSDADRLTASPVVFDDGGTSFGFRLLGEETSWDLVVLDLDARPIRSLGGDGLGPGPRTVVWNGRADDGRPVPAGPWLVLLRTRDDAGRLNRRDRIVVVRDLEGP